MRQLQPVIWMKGTALSPQHLQSQDRFIEDSLRFRLESLSANPWGFLTLQIDQEALAGGIFTLSAASGVFPDGLLFDFPVSYLLSFDMLAHTCARNLFLFTYFTKTPGGGMHTL